MVDMILYKIGLNIGEQVIFFEFSESTKNSAISLGDELKVIKYSIDNEIKININREKIKLKEPPYFIYMGLILISVIVFILGIETEKNEIFNYVKRTGFLYAIIILILIGIIINGVQAIIGLILKY